MKLNVTFVAVGEKKDGEEREKKQAGDWLSAPEGNSAEEKE